MIYKAWCLYLLNSICAYIDLDSQCNLHMPNHVYDK